MAIRNSAKALILHDGKLLLNKCVSRLGMYYALPGGGQHDGELLTEAVRREVMEETGLSVEPMRLSAVFERVSDDRIGSVNAHKMYFVFLCRYLPDVAAREPVERDPYQVGMEWVSVDDAVRASLFPRVIRDNLPALLDYGETIYLGSERRGGPR
ncbi:MAG: NUDIX domain-containing protein [Clostridia bacterium]|nr:NUDIX domain-containing protein [Clostridia bacterium]